MSGIEALYWVQKYPDEIEAIIGLDMAVPEYYENMKINLALMKLGQYAADLGITRLIPTLAESDAIKHGTLTNDEKNRYRAIFYNRTATVTMINEAKSVKDNARIVAQNGEYHRFLCCFLFLMVLVELVLIKKHGEGYRKNTSQKWSLGST